MSVSSFSNKTWLITPGLRLFLRLEVSINFFLPRFNQPPWMSLGVFGGGGGMGLFPPRTPHPPLVPRNPTFNRPNEKNLRRTSYLFIRFFSRPAFLKNLGFPFTSAVIFLGKICFLKENPWICSYFSLPSFLFLSHLVIWSPRPSPNPPSDPPPATPTPPRVAAYTSGVPIS